MQALRAHRKQPDLHLILRHRILVWKKVGGNNCCIEPPPMEQEPAAKPLSWHCLTSSCNESILGAINSTQQVAAQPQALGFQCLESFQALQARTQHGATFTQERVKSSWEEMAGAQCWMDPEIPNQKEAGNEIQPTGFQLSSWRAGGLHTWSQCKQKWHCAPPSCSKGGMNAVA